MRIEINEANRADIALMFEGIAEVIKEQSPQATSIAVSLSDTGIVVEVEGKMEGDPDGRVYWGQDAFLILDGKLIAVRM